MRICPAFLFAFLPLAVHAQDGTIRNDKFKQEDKFRQLEEALPTPNDERTASGAPGRGYWQQKANYDVDVELDDEAKTIKGRETVTYTNQSPDALGYLWLQLDPNIFRPDSDANLTQTSGPIDRLSFDALKGMMVRRSFDGGVNIRAVQASSGEPLKYTVNKTMMRIDLPDPLEPGESAVFNVEWDYAVNDAKVVFGRTGYEQFDDEAKNRIYEIAQWFPRLAAYTDYTGWQHKQYLGSGEFTLEFGDYTVRITAPDDHVVAATGVLQNPDDVLKPEWKDRLKEARTAGKPVFIVTPDEAKANEKGKPTGKKTWVFKADDVRDFAFASSRKFIWDAQGHDVGGNPVMAMSYYPNEAEPLWSKYSTPAIVHTLNVYSRYTFDYPYPTAISVNGPVGGMEYPMICFNGPRPQEDGTYSARTKYALISVIIHEVGHNFFPMIVNSDERQWTWMDEGLNTFLQYLSEQEWEEDYPSQRGEPKEITGYMASTDQVPIMVNSESLLQFGPNAYAKPATALNILRESILGRELFDHAFKEYARRWKFRRPTPADLFRTIEDASGTDLDWFWRGWFYTTDHCDLAIDDVQVFTIDPGDPEANEALARQKKAEEPVTLSQERNEQIEKLADKLPDLKDFYNSYDPLDAKPEDLDAFKKFLDGLSDDEKELLKTSLHFNLVQLRNVGGLVMPVILELEFDDGSKQVVRIPAEIWRHDVAKVGKMILTDKPVKAVTLDPRLETADVDLDNNHWPPKVVPSRFKLFKGERRGADAPNPMREARERERKKTDEKGETKPKDPE